MNRRLPIGIQSFRNLREDGCIYVDKTQLVKEITDQGRYFFLSRPRRFGKSLLLDTIRELFDCNESLFEGLLKQLEANDFEGFARTLGTYFAGTAQQSPFGAVSARLMP